MMVGIADVNTFVPKNSAIDQHAAKETTTVYTGVRIFSMLPEQLSTGMTSLLEGADKLSLVIEFVVSPDGRVNSDAVHRAIVRNKAQLTYDAMGAWLEGKGAAPDKVAASPELQSQLRLQDEVAQALMNERYRHGALNIETTEVRPIILNQQVVGVAKQEKNRATELIEDFMIAAKWGGCPYVAASVFHPARGENPRALETNRGACRPTRGNSCQPRRTPGR
jgi:exoribonuclease R